jgi:hypothetical protein
MRRLAAHLQHAGFTVHNLNYPSRRLPADELVHFVSAEIAKHCAGVSRIHGVGHSLGALLLRAWAASATRERARLSRLVLLAPPNSGSEIVDRVGGTGLFRLLFGPAGGVLGTAADAFPHRIPTVSCEVGVIAATRSINPIGSLLLPGRNDGAVSVYRTHLQGMRDHIEMPHSHTLVMRAPRVMEQVLHFLRYGCFKRRGTPERR